MATTPQGPNAAAARAAAPPATPPTVTVLMSPEQHAAQTLAAELEERRRSGTELSRTTPGGHYIGTDGRPHDAHGNKLDAKNEGGDVSKMDFENVSEELRQNDERRASLLARMDAARAESLAQTEQ